MTLVDARAIAERFVPQEAVRKVQRHGFLRPLHLDEREIRERLWRAHLAYVGRRRSRRLRPMGLTDRTQLVLAVGVLCLASAGEAFGAEQPRSNERLAQAVAHAQQIRRDVELRLRLPDGRRLHVAEVTTMLGVATLETLDPASWSGRSIPTGNGIYVSLCGRGARRHCAIGAGGARAGDALVARTQALEIARRTLLERRWISSSSSSRSPDPHPPRAAALRGRPVERRGDRNRPGNGGPAHPRPALTPRPD